MFSIGSKIGNIFQLSGPNFCTRRRKTIVLLQLQNKSLDYRLNVVLIEGGKLFEQKSLVFFSFLPRVALPFLRRHFTDLRRRIFRALGRPLSTKINVVFPVLVIFRGIVNDDQLGSRHSELSLKARHFCGCHKQAAYIGTRLVQPCTNFNIPLCMRT